MSPTTVAAPERADLPARVRRPSLLTLVIVLVVGGLLVHGWTQGATVRPDSLATGVFRLGEFLQDASFSACPSPCWQRVTPLRIGRCTPSAGPSSR
jgi:hypothetical protein